MTGGVHMEVRHREGDGLKEIKQGHKGHFSRPVHTSRVRLATSSKMAPSTVYVANI